MRKTIWEFSRRLDTEHMILTADLAWKAPCEWSKEGNGGWTRPKGQIIGNNQPLPCLGLSRITHPHDTSTCEYLPTREGFSSPEIYSQKDSAVTDQGFAKIQSKSMVHTLLGPPKPSFEIQLWATLGKGKLHLITRINFRYNLTWENSAICGHHVWTDVYTTSCAIHTSKEHSRTPVASVPSKERFAPL